MTSDRAHLKIDIGEREPNFSIFSVEITDGVCWIKHFWVIFEKGIIMPQILEFSFSMLLGYNNMVKLGFL